MSTEAPERLLNTREVAGLLGLSYRQVVRLWSERGLPGYRLGERGIVRFRLSEIEAWLRARDEARAAELEITIAEPPPLPEVVHHDMPIPGDDRTSQEVIAGTFHTAFRQRFDELLRKNASPAQLATASIELLLDPHMNAMLPELYRPAARKRRGKQSVYFAKLGSLVKIGISVNPETRVQSIGAVLVATEPGGRAREMELHSQFGEARERLEWFREHDALIAYVESLETFTGWPA